MDRHIVTEFLRKVRTISDGHNAIGAPHHSWSSMNNPRGIPRNKSNCSNDCHSHTQNVNATQREQSSQDSHILHGRPQERMHHQPFFMEERLQSDLAVNLSSLSSNGSNGSKNTTSSKTSFSNHIHMQPLTLHRGRQQQQQQQQQQQRSQEPQQSEDASDLVETLKSQNSILWERILRLQHTVDELEGQAARLVEVNSKLEIELREKEKMNQQLVQKMISTRSIAMDYTSAKDAEISLLKEHKLLLATKNSRLQSYLRTTDKFIGSIQSQEQEMMKIQQQQHLESTKSRSKRKLTSIFGDSEEHKTPNKTIVLVESNECKKEFNTCTENSLGTGSATGKGSDVIELL